MNGYIIRQHMDDKKIRVNDIAASLGVTQSAVSQVIHGRTQSNRLKKAIADAIGKPVSEVFPDDPKEQA